MGDGAVKGGGVQVPLQETTPNAESPAFVPRKLTPNQLFGSGRGDHVAAERQAAASQIQRTLRVWRKASSAPEEAKGNGEEKEEGAEVSEPGEPAEKEADAVAEKAADELHDDSPEEKKSGDKGDNEAKEQAPEIGAKLEGVGLKVYRSKKNKDDDDSWKTDPDIMKQIEEMGLPLAGAYPFVPKIETKNGKRQLVRSAAVNAKGNAKGKKGPEDREGKIWIRNYAHALYGDHWDVQIDQGSDYINVGLDGNPAKKLEKGDPNAKAGAGFGAAKKGAAGGAASGAPGGDKKSPDDKAGPGKGKPENGC